MEVGEILLYCFYACLQMFILMLVGMLSVIKKILNKKKSNIFSTAAFALVIPFFHIIQIAQAGTYNILKLLWIIELNFIIAMIISYIISIIVQKIFNLDIRVKNSYSAMVTFPAVGALPIVIGYGYCFPGGPIEHDDFCQKFRGIMMLSVLALTLGMYCFGTILLMSDRRVNEDLNIKIKYVWNKIIKSIYGGNDTSVLYLFKEFYDEQKKAIEDFVLFEKDISNEIRKSDFKDISNLNLHENENNDINNNENNIKDNDYHLTSSNLIEVSNINTLKNKEEEEKIKCEKIFIKAFEKVEKNLNKEKLESFTYEKEQIIKNLEKNPPEYPIDPYIKITQSNYSKILKEYDEWYVNEKKIYPNLNIKLSNVKIDIFALIKALLAPPTNSFYLGLILGISYMREIIFADNIFWKNIIDGINVISGAFSPFLFLVIGVACLPQEKTPEERKQKSKVFLISKTHVVIIFVVRFIIVPILGIFAILFWKNVYGKECESSLVFRLVLFFPWCLPSSTTFSVLVNLTGYFFEEYGYLIMLQNFSCVITLTVLNMIYFLLVGQ